MSNTHHRPLTSYDRVNLIKNISSTKDTNLLFELASTYVDHSELHKILARTILDRIPPTTQCLNGDPFSSAATTVTSIAKKYAPKNYRSAKTKVPFMSPSQFQNHLSEHKSNLQSTDINSEEKNAADAIKFPQTRLTLTIPDHPKFQSTAKSSQSSQSSQSSKLDPSLVFSKSDVHKLMVKKIVFFDHFPSNFSIIFRTFSLVFCKIHAKCKQILANICDQYLLMCQKWTFLEKNIAKIV